LARSYEGRGSITNSQEGKNALGTVKRKQAKWIDHIEYDIEGKIEEAGRRGRRR